VSTLATLISYLPVTLAARILQEPERDYFDESRRYYAAVLFADLAKFTPLTETFCRAGPSGVEALTALLNSYFTALIAEIDQWGGVVGKFAGDSMTVFFTGADAPLRAAACAQAVLNRSQRFDRVQTPNGQVTLQMKLGLAYGEVLEVIVGNDWHAEFVFAGEPLDAAAQAEHHASPLQIVLDASIQALLPAKSVRLTPIGEGFAILEEVAVLPEPQPLAALTLSESPLVEQRLRPFLPRPAYERVKLGLSAFVNEHRPVCTLFVNFEGIDYTVPDAGHQLGGYLRPFFEIVNHYEGFIHRVEIGDKGSKVVVVFGAPAAHENDVERALLCALDLQAWAAERPEVSRQKIGLTTGFVFAGNVGAPHRQEYSTMGDVVNLAARLMQAAEPGQIWADEATRRAAPLSFVWQALPPLTVKGKSQPVTAFVLERRLHPKAHALPAANYRLPMIGRQAELERIEQHLLSVKQTRHGRVIGITAEAGMGKTRLAAEVIRRALALGFQGFAGNGVSHGATTPYLAWRPIVRALFDLDEERPLAEQTENVRAFLAAIDPYVVERLPLLGDVLGETLPDSEVTVTFDANLRRQSLFALIADVVRWRAAQAPLLLVLEDAHWLDELSRELARSLAASIADVAVFFLTVYRLPETETQAALWAAPPDFFDEFRLNAFSPEETQALMCLKLGDAPLPAALRQRIEQLAQGNPFFLDELLNLVQAHLAEGDSLETLQIPDSVQALIVSRLDQLGESEKMTLRVASVIGALFRSRWLLAIYPVEIQEQLLHQNLARASEAGMILIERVSPELEYLFRHAIMQEVVYGTLSFANRRMLHERVANYLESVYANDLGPWYAILAFHAARAAQVEREYRYTVQAARQAARQSAYRQAFDFYGRALQLVSEYDLAAAAEIFDLRAERLKQGRILGEYALISQEADLLGALMPEVNLPRQVQALILQAVAAMHVGRLEDGRALLEQAIPLAKTGADSQGLAQALFELAGYYFDITDYPAVKRTLQEMISVEAAGDAAAAQARAQRILAWVYYDEGDYVQAESCWQAALQSCQRRGDKPGEAITLSNLAALFATLDQVETAIAMAEHSLALASQIGYKVGELEAWRMLGDFFFSIGQHERAWNCLQRCIEISHQLAENLYGLAYSWARQALILCETGADLLQAEAVALQAVDLVKEKAGQELKGWVYYAYAAVLAAKGDYQAAAQSYEESLRLRREMGQIDTVLPTLAGLAETRLLQGDVNTARQVIDEALPFVFSPQAADRDVYRASLVAYLVLRTCGEIEPARRALYLAHTLMQERLSKLKEAAYRQSFRENIRLNRQIMTAYQEEFQSL